MTEVRINDSEQLEPSSDTDFISVQPEKSISQRPQFPSTGCRNIIRHDFLTHTAQARRGLRSIIKLAIGARVIATYESLPPDDESRHREMTDLYRTEVDKSHHREITNHPEMTNHAAESRHHDYDTEMARETSSWFSFLLPRE